MTFRSRVAALVALAVAVAFLLASLVMLTSTRRSLLSAVDAQLREAVAPPVPGAGGAATGLAALRDFLDDRRGPTRPGGAGRPAAPRGPSGDVLRGVGLVQLVRADGVVVLTLPEDGDALPVSDAILDLDRGDTPLIETVRTQEAAYRVIGAAVRDNFVVQVARPIDDIEDGLDRLVAQLSVVSVLGIGFAFLAGLFVADRVLVPVRRLTATAELIADTQELAHRAVVAGDDELARLATALNRMLTALDTSRRAQHQLVADASHELRTPLTSLRTNIELLASADRLTKADRAAMRQDLLGQIDEMTLLIGNLVDLARDGSDPVQRAEVHLDELVVEVMERQRRLHPDVEFVVEVQPSVVLGDRDRLERAVTNLVDNAVKYAGHAGPVHAEVEAGMLTVRDHGPGVPAEDREHVFDRFWRSAEARGAPGSGLGLAIVAQVAAGHGGTVEVRDAAGGGAAFVLTLPEARSD